MNGITIRDAREVDVEPIADIHVRTWQHAYRGLMPDPYLDQLSVSDRLALWTRVMERPPPRSTLLVAEANGAIAGFAMAGPSGDDAASETTAQLFTIYVEPGRMGRGVGSALLHQMEQRLASAGFAEATLWVLTGNERGRGYYERHGWHPDRTTRREQLWGATVDEVPYRKPLHRADPGAT